MGLLNAAVADCHASHEPFNTTEFHDGTRRSPTGSIILASTCLTGTTIQRSSGQVSTTVGDHVGIPGVVLLEILWKISSFNMSLPRILVVSIYLGTIADSGCLLPIMLICRLSIHQTWKVYRYATISGSVHRIRVADLLRIVYAGDVCMNQYIILSIRSFVHSFHGLFFPCTRALYASLSWPLSSFSSLFVI
jgi:hypothetical protein